MKRSTPKGILTSKGYAKKYEKNADAWLNARFMHMLIAPKDVNRIKVVAYEKQLPDKSIEATCILQYVRLKCKVTLKYMSFSIKDKLGIDDYHLKHMMKELATEQVELQEALGNIDFMIL